jgi:hypothetical protein
MISSLMYIGYALTALYPVLQSIRDDVAFDGFEHLKRGLGGYELYLFNISIQSISAAFVVSGFLLYSVLAVLVMIGLFLIIYT